MSSLKSQARGPGFLLRLFSGQLQLRDASAELQGVNEPLHIVSAQTTIAGQGVNVASFSGAFGKGNRNWW